MDGTATLDWIAVGTLDEIPRHGARVVTSPRGDIALFRTGDDRIFALDDRCPHKAGRLSGGIVHGHSVTCPLHNWVIDLESGTAHTPDQGCTATIPTRLQDGQILLNLAPSPSAIRTPPPLPLPAAGEGRGEGGRSNQPGPDAGAPTLTRPSGPRRG